MEDEDDDDGAVQKSKLGVETPPHTDGVLVRLPIAARRGVGIVGFVWGCPVLSRSASAKNGRRKIRSQILAIPARGFGVDLGVKWRSLAERGPGKQMEFRDTRGGWT